VTPKEIPKEIWFCQDGKDEGAEDTWPMSLGEDCDRSDNTGYFCKYHDKPCDAIECVVIRMSDIEKIREDGEELLNILHRNGLRGYEHLPKRILNIIKDGE
jgi:hypothetical protein